MTDRQTWVRTSIKTYLKWVNFVLKDDNIETLDEFCDGNVFKKLINSFFDKRKPFKILPPSKNTYKNLQELDNVINFLATHVDSKISKYDSLALYDGNQTQILSILYIIYATFAFNSKLLRIKGTIKSKKKPGTQKDLKSTDSPGTLPDDLPEPQLNENLFMSPIKAAPKPQLHEDKAIKEIEITTEKTKTEIEVPKVILKKSDIQKWILELGHKLQIPNFTNIIDAENNKLLLVKLVKVLVKNKIAKSDHECLLDSQSITDSEDLTLSNATLIDKEDDTITGGVGCKQLNEAIATAHDKFGIPKLLDAEDNAQFLDHASILLYFSAFIKYKSQIDQVLDKQLVNLELVSAVSYPDKDRKNLLTQVVLKSEVEILPENIPTLNFKLVREEGILSDADDSLSRPRKSSNSIEIEQNERKSISYISTVSCVSEFSEKSHSKSSSRVKGSDDEADLQDDFDNDDIDSSQNSSNTINDSTQSINNQGEKTGKYLVLELKCNKTGKYNLIVSIAKHVPKLNKAHKQDSLFSSENVVKTLNLGLNKGIDEDTINWNLTKKIPFIISSNISSAKLSLFKKDDVDLKEETNVKETLYLVPINSNSLQLKMETFDEENNPSFGYNDKLTAFHYYFNKNVHSADSELGSMESEELFIKDILFNSTTKRNSVNYYNLKLPNEQKVLNNFIIINMDIKNTRTNDIFLFFVDTKESFINDLRENLKQLDTDAVNVEENFISIKNQFFYNLLTINSFSKKEMVKFKLEKNEIKNVELNNLNREFEILLYFDKKTEESEDLLQINVPSLQVEEKIHISTSKELNKSSSELNETTEEGKKERALSNNLEQVWRIEKECKFKECATEFINSKEGMYIVVLQHKRLQCFNIKQLSIIKDNFKDVNKDKLYLKVKDKSKFMGSASRKIDVSSITSIVKGKKTTGFDMFNIVKRKSSIASISKGLNFLRKNIKAKGNAAVKRAKKFVKKINQSKEIKSSQCLSVICPEITLNIVAESSSDRNYIYDCLMGLILFEKCVEVKSNFICNNGRKLKECVDEEWYDIIDIN
eukprot:GAHX01001895.1.p1 GENE.GAHX01001895.1~~GAHX01001895.1.p1  ORF type:complete len:1047 (+),score=257.56 GAHX01001895.1:32-3172(+)